MARQTKGGIVIIKQVTALLLTFLFIFTGTFAVAADSHSTKQVDASSLYLREAPGSESEVLGALSRGTEVTVQEEKYGWANVDYNGQSGWVAGHYLVSAGNSASSGQTASGDIIVQADTVYLRQGPGTETPIVGFAGQGDTYQKLEEQNGWVKVQLGNGSEAWIAGFLTSSGRATAVKASHSASPSEDISSLKNSTIVVDAGHGGYEPGAIGRDGTLEKNLTLQTAQTVAGALRYAGAEVIMTRTSDRYVSLFERTGSSARHNADAFVSLHYNSHKYESARGISSYYYGSPSLAASIQNRLTARTSYQDDGTLHGNFQVLRGNKAPAALLELGYISNGYELDLAKTRDHQNQVAQAVTEGLRNYLSK